MQKEGCDTGPNIYRKTLVNIDKGLVQAPDKIAAMRDLSLFVRRVAS
jgi:hypothetical protein